MNMSNIIIEDSGDIRKIQSWGYCDFSKELTEDWIQIQSPTEQLPNKREDQEYRYDSINETIIVVESEIIKTIDIEQEIKDIKLRLNVLEGKKWSSMLHHRIK